MDDEAALRAARVARAAAVWLASPSDYEAYRRLLVSVDAWNAYRDPLIPLEAEAELLDGLAADAPRPLGDGVADLERRLRHSARRAT